jgi:hypothetical protein
MSTVVELRGRAEHCRSAAYSLPVVSTVEEARALGLRIAEQLASLSGHEALLCLSSLQDVQAVLTARVSRLQDEMAATRRELQRVDAAVRTCRQYGETAAGAGRRSR